MNSHLSLHDLRPVGKNLAMAPLELTIEITKKCPLRCLICSSDGGSRYPRELTLKELRRVIDDASELGTRTVIFSGGEPFEHPRLIDLCEHAKSRGLDANIYTCGNLTNEGSSVEPIPEDMISRLGKVPISKAVFGLQGPTGEIHDSITCIQGSFKNAIISIRSFVRRKIPVEVHFVPTKMNYRYLPQMLLLARNLQVDKVSVLRFVPQGRGELNRDMLELEPREASLLRSMLKDMMDSRIVKIRVGAPFNAFCLSEGNHCTAGRSRATVRADGFVFPCEALKQWQKYSDNNVRVRGLREIWKKSAIFEEARNFGTLIDKSFCSNCKMFSRCGGGCPAQRLTLGSSIQKNPDPLCPATEVIMKNV